MQEPLLPSGFFLVVTRRAGTRSDRLSFPTPPPLHMQWAVPNCDTLVPENGIERVLQGLWLENLSKGQPRCMSNAIDCRVLPSDSPSFFAEHETVEEQADCFLLHKINVKTDLLLPGSRRRSPSPSREPDGNQALANHSSTHGITDPCMGTGGYCAEEYPEALGRESEGISAQLAAVRSPLFCGAMAGLNTGGSAPMELSKGAGKRIRSQSQAARESHALYFPQQRRRGRGGGRGRGRGGHRGANSSSSPSSPAKRSQSAAGSKLAKQEVAWARASKVMSSRSVATSDEVLDNGTCGMWSSGATSPEQANGQWSDGGMSGCGGGRWALPKDMLPATVLSSNGRLEGLISTDSGLGRGAEERGGTPALPCQGEGSKTAVQPAFENSGGTAATARGNARGKKKKRKALFTSPKNRRDSAPASFLGSLNSPSGSDPRSHGDGGADTRTRSLLDGAVIPNGLQSKARKVLSCTVCGRMFTYAKRHADHEKACRAGLLGNDAGNSRPPLPSVSRTSL